MAIKYDLDKITGGLQKRVTNLHRAAANFDAGDHWQNGAGFTPLANMDAEARAMARVSIANSFVSENVIAKVISNEQNGLLGREPDWAAIPAESPYDGGSEGERKERSLIELIEKALLLYWNERECINTMREAFRIAACEGRAVVRAFLPPGYADGEGRVAGRETLLDAMRMLQFEVLHADAAGVFRDEDFNRPFGVHIKDSEGRRRTEITFTDENNLTRLRIITENALFPAAGGIMPTLMSYVEAGGAREVFESKPQDLGGQILLFEISRRPLITESIISGQKLLNLNHTMKGKNTFQAGYRDFIGINLDAPAGEIEMMVDGVLTKISVPRELIVGGNNINFLQGAPVWDKTDPQNPKIMGFANGDVKILEPVSPSVFIEGEASEKAAIYEQCNQEHLLISDSATPSGKSRKEARDGFEKALKDLKPAFDALGRWMLTILFRFGAENSAELPQAATNNYRFDFNCIVDAGSVDTETRRLAAIDVAEGRLSNETYLSKFVGVEDADAEQARIDRSEAARLAQMRLRLETAQKASDLGLPASFVAEMLNIADESIKKEIIESLARAAGEQTGEGALKMPALSPPGTFSNGNGSGNSR